MKAIVTCILNRRIASSTNAPTAGAPLNVGDVIEITDSVEGETVEGNALWYKTTDGCYVWSGGVSTANPQDQANSYSWWIDALCIPEIWRNYNEYGEKAAVAILDSGYNVNNSDVAEGVKCSGIFFKSANGTPIAINDSYGHGSHCASLIGGRNIKNITGCAPLSELYIAKICSQGSVKSYTSLVTAIQWAIDNRADIISISYGGEDPDEDLERMINSAVNEHNILVIASIGDTQTSNLPCYPASYSNCLAVGATNEKNEISAISIVNDKTEIYAPGENIMGYWLGNTPEAKNGTSQAAAIMSGICALIVSRHKKLGKSYTVNSIRNLIIQNADFISENQKLISPIKIFKNI